MTDSNNNNSSSSVTPSTSVTSTPVTSSTIQSAAANPTPPSGTSSSGSGGEANISSKVSSMNQLKQKAPKVYNMMMQGIAMQICQTMQDEQAQLKQLQQSYG